jgi:hypothetical protein
MQNQHVSINKVEVVFFLFLDQRTNKGNHLSVNIVVKELTVNTT